jgi:VanZ family protein
VTAKTSPPSDQRTTRSPDREALSLWGPVVVYMAAIFFVSGMSAPPVPQDVPDVSLHEAAYFGLTLLLVRALARGSWNGVTLATLAGAWVVAVAYGFTDEFHQSYVPNRHAELRDLAADAIGAFAATIVAGAWGIIRRL